MKPNLDDLLHLGYNNFMKTGGVSMKQDPFKDYLRESEPDKAGRGYAWSTAIGLQAVDGLTPSRYLIDTAIQNI